MYTIACRAHFHHLLGLGQVGHSPRGTSGSDGTLDWGPMWFGSQSTCHPQCIPDNPTPPDTPTPLTPLMPPNGPNTPMSPKMCPYAIYIPSGPEYLQSLPAPNTLLTPPNGPNIPKEPPNAPLFHLYLFWLLRTTLLARPQYIPDTNYTPDAP